MRSHAKASTAGSTQRYARRLSALAVALCAVLAGMALVAASASARVHLFQEVFGSAARPSFANPADMAVDAAGNVLVIDVPNLTVSRFHPDGTPADFSALGTNVIDGKSGEDETPGGRGILRGEAYGRADEFGIAVDRSGGVANGDIYITNVEAGVVDIFAPTGKYLGRLTEFGVAPTNQPLGEGVQVKGVTVDESGAVYVADGTNGIQKYVPTTNPPSNADFVATFTEAQTGIGNTASIAAGSASSAGYLFVERYGRGTVAKIDSSTGAVEYRLQEEAEPPAPPGLLSVDPNTGHVYLGYGTTVREFDASGPSPIAASAPIQLEGEARGVAVDGDSGDIYVSREGTETIDVYGPATSLPVITEEGSESVVFTDAKLRAKVYPNGLATTYHFEYGTDDSYGKSSPEKLAGSDETTHDVNALLEGLSPGTTYHWRIVATNSAGTTEGPDHTLTTDSTLALDTECANQAFRVGPSALLPDCRAYEMVSPVDKDGGDIVGFCSGTCSRTEINQASVEGGKFTFSSYKAFGDAPAGRYSNQYMATRGPEGWSTRSISPPYVAGIEFQQAPELLELEFSAFSPDLSQSWLLDTSKVPLTPEGVPGYDNLYHINSNGSLTALTRIEPKTPFKIYLDDFQGHSSDGEAAIFTARGELLPSNDRIQLYDFADGELHLVSVLPNGEAATGDEVYGATAGAAMHSYEHAFYGDESLDHAISDDGSRVFWSTVEGFVVSGIGDELYVRLNPTQPQSALNGANECTEAAKACTLAISEGEAWFWTATPDGSEALFTEVNEDTVDNQVRGGLYTFDVNTGTKTLIAHRTLGVAGASEDLSHIYFVSEEALAPGGTAGERNLYLDDEGELTYIAALSGVDTAVTEGPISRKSPSVIAPRPVQRATRVTSNGRYLAFMSTARLTGYDNTDPSNGKASAEVYLYDADSERLICVSCNPSGARPHGAEVEPPYSDPGNGYSGVAVWAAAWLNTSENSLHTPHALSADGNRLFFNSYDALVPRDTNGAQDVYEWEAPGSGSCTTQSSEYSEANDGCINLISTGLSPQKSEFVDATPDGSEVFFKTSASIDPRDPGLIDIYDAHVEGGYPPPLPPPTPCLGDACQGVPGAPNDQTPASASFRGAGDLVPRKARGCKARKRHAKGKHRKAKRKAAKSCRRANRRAGR